MQVLSQVRAVAQELLVVDLEEVLFPVVDLLVDLALLLAISAADPTISLATVCKFARAPLMNNNE